MWSSACNVKKKKKEEYAQDMKRSFSSLDHGAQSSCGDAQATQESGVGRRTVGQAMDAVATQCLSRGLQDTAVWLSELALSATHTVLKALLSTNCALCSTTTIDDALYSEGLAVGRSFSPCDDVPSPSLSCSLAAAARRYQQLGLGLFLKGEYLRCHHILSNAIRELTEKGSRDSGSSHNRADPKQGRCQRGKDVRAGCSAGSTSATDALVGEIFPPHNTTRLPSCIPFLCFYALYMCGQQCKHTNSAAGSRSACAVNPHLRTLRALLTEALRNPQFCVTASLHDGDNVQTSGGDKSSAIEGAGRMGLFGGRRRLPPAADDEQGDSLLLRQDPYLAWLMGVVLRDLGMKQESATYLLTSVRINPLLWCAWQDLATLVSRESQIDEMQELLQGLEPTFMVDIFLAHVKASLGVAPLSVCAAVHTAADNHSTPTWKRGSLPRSGTPPPPASARCLVNTWQALLEEEFPKSLYLRTRLAGYYYNQCKELDCAEQLYKQVYRADPYRMDYVVDYSNILFMKSDGLALSGLAQQMYHVDAFRAESNFVVGNYYVLLRQHERSVLHFRRATAIQPSLVAAWTLLGHAYVEIKNTTAAVEAYRTAVELDEKDYRGWYNLGQIYELLQAYHHALFYYWHATSLRPTDPRMWTAVSNCLEHDSRLGESIVCLERAEMYEPAHSSVYPDMVRRIATFYIDRKNFQRASVYLEKLIQSRMATDDDLRFSLPFLIQYYVIQARQLVELPARSPSFELASATSDGSRPSPGGAGKSQSGRAHLQTSHQPRSERREGSSATSYHLRGEQALEHLAAAEAHMETFVALTRHLGNVTAPEPSSGLLSALPPSLVVSRAAEEQQPQWASSIDHRESAFPQSRLGQSSSCAGGSAGEPNAVGAATHAQTTKFISRMWREIQSNRRLIEQRWLANSTPP